MEQIVVRAYAKINLTLDIEGRRHDGYHLLNTVFQTVSIYDEITIEPSGNVVVTSDCAQLSDGPENLAHRAACLMLELGEQKQLKVKGAKIKIKKSIPLAAGLAGGSSDAAAVMNGINCLFGLGFTIAELMHHAVKLGADVPFCLLGGTAWGRGIGEKLSILPALPKLWLVLCKPDLEVSTAEIYKNYSGIRGRKYSSAFISALEQGKKEEMLRNMGNVLENVTLSSFPEVKKVKQKLLEAGAGKAVMCGSGPTVFAVCKDKAHAEKVAGEVGRTYRETFVVQTV